MNITKPNFFLDIEIRDVIFHPYKPLLFSCSDGMLILFFNAYIFYLISLCLFH